MITRLQNLDVKGFRSFQALTSIDLDADVVLIYGKNGSGKTSLVSAIELAITGSVVDLARYTDDYPRCLKNVKWNDQGLVKLTMTTPDGTKESERSFDGGKLVRFTGFQETKLFHRFFIDRCYLSQSKLSRLLELYQAPDGENPEQLLIRFVRELLGLGVLENLTGGLFESGDVRRLEGASNNFHRLRIETTQIEKTLTTAKAKVSTVNEALSQLKQTIKTKIEHAGDPLPGETWEHLGIINRITSLSARTTVTELLRLREIQGRLTQITGYISQTSVGTDPSQKRQIEEKLEELTVRREALITILNDAVKLAANGAPQIVAVLEDPSLTPMDIEKFESVKAICQRIITTANSWAQAKSDIEGEIASIRKDIEAKQGILQSLNNQVRTQSIELSQRQLSFLSAIAQHIHTNDCPVCKRDYSEVNAGTLKVMIEQEIQKLGGNIQTIEAEQKHRNETQSALNTAFTKLQSAELRLHYIVKEVENQITPIHVIQNVLATLETHESIVIDIDNARKEEVGLLTTLTSIRIKLKQIEEAQTQTAALSKELGFEDATPSADLKTKVLNLQKLVDESAKFLESRRSLEDEIKLLHVRIDSAFRDSVNAQKELDNTLLRQSEIRDKTKAVEAHVELARRLSRAAANAKTRLLDRVFNETLNRLWRDLYNRLAKSEDFVPQLTPPILSRGKIETHIAATMQGITPFNNFSSVSSLGNLNTAALSLFLALNLVEKPKHQLLILDDPVQNMDDLHVIQFAALLRSIAFQAKRQLIIAVHERALFDYLSLELGPSRQGDTLNMITVERDGNDGASTIQVEKRFWRRDKIEFGVKSLEAHA